MKNFLFSLILFCTAHCLNAQQDVTVTYTGNMGVLITHNNTSVWIDGLHKKYGDDYLFPPQELVEKLTKGQGTYSPPSLLLFTHKHGDHYNHELINNYLESHPKSIVVGPGQVGKMIKDDKNFAKVLTDDYSKQEFFHQDIKIRAFKMDHAGDRHISIENVGHLVSIGGKNLLHVGDTSWNLKNKMFKKLEIDKEHVDVAFLPYWMLLDKNAKSQLKKYFKSTQIVATHISPRIDKSDLDAIKEKYPKVHFLTQLEEQVKF
ncbi:hypothetical protein GTQ40_17915 [Flavobacteriaceae bacterium R38]|nr:hypothetical protein [Flavobacteriaceae bacterium R38]